MNDTGHSSISRTSQDWKYEYYCRFYPLHNVPNINGLLLTIDDPRVDPLNPSCIANRSAGSPITELSRPSLPSSPSRKRKRVAVWRISCLTEVIDHHHFAITSAQSNIPVHGLHGESTKLHRPGHGLSAGACRRHSPSTSRHRVSCLPF